MAGQFSRKPTPQPIPPAGISPTLFRHQQLWRKLAAYRPLLILAGIWVVLLTISMVAYEHLLHTTKDSPATDAAPEITVYPHQRLADEDNGTASTSQVSPDDASHASGQLDAESSASDAETLDGLDEAPAPTATAISPGSLGLLVTICALGCLILSRQFQSPPRPRRKSSKRILKHRQLLSSPPPVKRIVKDISPPSGPERLAPYDPTQPLVTASLPHQQPSSTSSTPADSLQTFSQKNAEVTVVPDETQHPLDWPKDSLVNTADVRQRRSLSSFL
ncbi:MAG: hypothetical protein F6K42_06190 [Leptolyngbya sp. SIO1D8]|nr:hypothetical protein [Leptolyngbya sp. SIO1D8]